MMVKTVTLRERTITRKRDALNSHLNKIFDFVDIKHVENPCEPKFLIVNTFACYFVPLIDKIFYAHNVSPKLFTNFADCSIARKLTTCKREGKIQSII